MKSLITGLLFAFTVVAMDITAIYHPEGQLSTLDKFAVKELSEHLEKVLGRKVPCSAEPTTPVKGAIYLGHTKLAAANKIDFSSFKPEEWLIKECDGALVLCGHEIHGNLYAVYEFLERFADIDWLDEHTTYIPEGKKIDVPANTELRGVPSVRFRGIYSYKQGDFNKDIFVIRNRESLFFEKPSKRIASEVGFTPVIGSPRALNTFFFYVKEWPKEGFEQFYSMNTQGKRVRPVNEFGPGQICFSNKDCQEKYANQMIEYIKKDREVYPNDYPMIYNLSANDNKDICNCPECQALAKQYDAQSGAMMVFVNAVAQKVAKVYPDITIQTSAYLAFEKAPKGIGVEKNVAVRYTPWIGLGMDTMLSINDPRNKAPLEALNAWSNMGRIQVWNYWVSYRIDDNACVVNIDSIQDNVRTYHKHGADYIFTECEFPDTTTFHPLRIWMGYKFLYDVNADKEALLNRFFTRYYGAAAPFLREYYNYICKRQQEAKRLNVAANAKGYLDEAFFNHCFPLIENAKNAVKDSPVHAAHVRNESVPFIMAAIACHPSANSTIPSKGDLVNLIKTDGLAAREYYFGKNAKGPNGMNDFILSHTPPQPGAKYPVPPEVEGKEVYEVIYDEFNKIGEMRAWGMRLVDDTDSPTGKAMRMGKKSDGFHKDQLTAGFQDRSVMKGFHSYEFKRDQLPQDEKYHFYDLGTVELHIMSLFWMHRTWLIQQDFSRYFTRGGDNKYRFYVSVKFTGPSYVKDSTSEDAISIDRFLLVRP